MCVAVEHAHITDKGGWRGIGNESGGAAAIEAAGEAGTMVA